MKTLSVLKLTSLVVLITTMIQPTFANDSYNSGGDENITQTQPILAQCKNQQLVKVNGLVCDFCARALEKVFSKQDAVNRIDVNLDSGLIGIVYHENQSIAHNRLNKLITDSGYNVVEFQSGCINE